jgi:hypothetical protein
MLYRFLSNDWTLALAFVLIIVQNAVYAFMARRAQDQMVETFTAERGFTLREFFAQFKSARAAAVLTELGKIPRAIFFISLIVHLYNWL